MSKSPQFITPQDYRRSDKYETVGVAGQFITIVRQILKADRHGPNWEFLASKFDAEPYMGRAASFCKAAMAAVDSDLWLSSDGQALSAAYLREIAPANLIDAVARYAFPVPKTNQPTMVALGSVAEEVAEGAGKPVTRFSLQPLDEQRAKVAAILVVTNEVAQSDELDATNLIRRLLRDAVVKSSNERFLARLPTIQVAAGATALESLKIGLAAAADSEGYVVAATGAATRELALASDGRMGVNGGEFVEGVTIVRALDAASTGHSLTVIPASTLALRDYGLEVRFSDNATIEMQDAPTGNSATPASAEMVNLFQTNCRGILVERHFNLRADSPAVEVG